MACPAFAFNGSNPAMLSLPGDGVSRQEDWAAVQASGSRDEKKAEGDPESPSAKKEDAWRGCDRHGSPWRQ